MRRAAISIPSNVAEGQVVRAPRWSLRQVAIAIASCAELDTQLDAAVRLHVVDDPGALPLRHLLERLQQVLHGLRRAKHRQIAAGAAAATGMLFMVSLTLT